MDVDQGQTYEEEALEDVRGSVTTMVNRTRRSHTATPADSTSTRLFRSLEPLQQSNKRSGLLCISGPWWSYI